MPLARVNSTGSGWSRRRKTGLAITGILAYVALACWAWLAHVPDRKFTVGPDVPGEKMQLYRPFPRYPGPTSHAFGTERYELFDELADSDDARERSPIELYEDGRRLGPAHATLDDIVTSGGGRFLHLRKNGTTVYFSTSDNSDPNSNGRAYWLVRPVASAKPNPSPAPGRVESEAVRK